MILKRGLLLMLFLILSSSAYAATYYVGQNSAGSGDGSSYDSRMSVSDFESDDLGQLDGDTIHLCDLFTTTVSVPDEGSSGNPVTIDGSCDGHEALLKGWDDYSCALLINQKDYVTIRNVNIDCDKSTKTAEHASQNGAGIKVVASSNLKFDNNDIQQSENGIHFVHISYPDNPGRNDNLVFTRNYIHDQPSSGIIMLLLHDDTIVGGSLGMGNVFKNNGYHVRSPENCCAPNADVRASSASINNIVISHNHMYAEQGSERGGGGIYINGGDNILIEYNEIHGHEGYGNRGAITLKADFDHITKNAVIRYNHIYDYPYLPSSYTTLSSGLGIVMDWEYIYVYGNYIHDVAAGIAFDKGWQAENNANGLNPKEGHCWGNIIYNAENCGIYTGGAGSDIIESIYIHNNIIYNAGTDPSEESINWKFTGIHFDNTYNGIANNNVVMDSRTNEAEIFEISGFSGDEPETSHTLYYRSDGATPQVYVYQNLCNPCDWDSPDNPYRGLGDDDRNPLFNNAGQGDLTLKSGSACIDSGVSIAGPSNIPAAVTSFAGSFSYDDVLHPDTDWSVFPSPSSIKKAKQSEHGSWERGAYVYDEGGVAACIAPDECCSAGQICDGGSFRSSPDCGSLCCVGGTCNTPTQTCDDLGGDCCTGSATCPGTDLGAASDCSGICCSDTCELQGYSYAIIKIPSAPTIDGSINEFNNANSIQVIDTETGSTGTYRLMWDEEALYVAAEFSDEKLNAEHTLEDADLWQDDSLEVMFDPDNDGGSSPDSGDYKFFVNVLDTRMDSQGYNADWDHAGLTHQVIAIGTVNSNSDTDTGYTLELKIPWSAWAITEPDMGTVWGMNIQLNDKTASGKHSTQWSDSGLDVNEPDGWEDVLFTHRADTGRNGCIEMNELTAFIDLWKQNSVNIGELMEAIGLWKGGY